MAFADKLLSNPDEIEKLQFIVCCLNHKKMLRFEVITVFNRGDEDNMTFATKFFTKTDVKI